MNKIKKTLCLILSFILLTQQGIVTQAKETADDTVKVTTVSESFINPLYEDIVDEAKITKDDSHITVWQVAPTANADYTSDENVIAQTIREGMVERQETISFSYTDSEDYDESKLKKWFEMALAETDSSEEGDYLRWNYERYEASISYYSSGGTYYYDYVMTITYYTTKTQEDKLTSEINSVLNSLGTKKSGLSNYEKAKKIYDYICDNITYDNANLNDESYKLKYTAYAALINKTAVCQGYATLMYRMLEESDIDTRVVFGTSYGDNHTWNISDMGTKYYLFDSTWDAGETSYSYFAKGKNNFPNHSTSSMSDFISDYDIDSSDYVYVEHTHTAKVTKAAKDATCTEDGNTEEVSCSECGTVLTKSETIPATGHVEAVTKEAKEATCTEDGNTEEVSCSVCGTVIQQAEVIEGGHEYGEPTFRWNADEGYECTAKFECQKCGRTEDVECDVTMEDTPATCTEDGVKVYTATCEFEGKTYVNPTKATYKYEPLGHEYTGDGVCTTCGETKPYTKIRFTKEETVASYTGKAIAVDDEIIEITEGNKTYRLEYYVDEACKIQTYYGNREKEWSAPTDPGVYYVKAFAAENDEYQFTEADTIHKLIIRPRRVASFNAANQSSSIKLTWEKRAEADGYIIYRKTDTTGYKVIKTITKNTTVSYTDGNISQRTKYRYNIVAYKVDDEGEEAVSLKRFSGTNIVRTKVISVTNQNGSVKIKWTKVPDAAGYKVYRKASGYDSYGLLTNIKKGSTTTYTDESAKSIRNGKASYYYVVPYYEDSSNVVLKTNTKTNYYVTRPVISSVKKSGNTALKVTWKKNDKATGYQIRYSTSSSMDNAKTVSVASKNTLSKKITGLTKNKNYYVQVRAYKTYKDVKYYSAWSAKKPVKLTGRVIRMR